MGAVKGGPGPMTGPGKGGVQPMPVIRPSLSGSCPQRPSGNPPLTAAALAAAPPSVQKQMLGETLFPAVSRFQPELAGKITGKMLEMDNTELLMLLGSDVQMRAKVEEV